jgi:hypothetical protein
MGGEADGRAFTFGAGETMVMVLLGKVCADAGATAQPRLEEQLEQHHL